MDWNAFTTEIDTLARKFDTTPDAIVAIARGGFVPARLLASRLKVKTMYGLTVEKAGDERQVVTDITVNLSGKTILLVEDMLETGRSFIVANEYLKSKGAIVMTACLYVMPNSEITPDFYLREAQSIEKFPWE